VESNREIIEDLMRRYGYEEEAEIAYHLREARTRLFELLRAEAEAGAGDSGGSTRRRSYRAQCFPTSLH
jgi:hypothetical protein